MIAAAKAYSLLRLWHFAGTPTDSALAATRWSGPGRDRRRDHLPRKASRPGALQPASVGADLAAIGVATTSHGKHRAQVRSNPPSLERTWPRFGVATTFHGKHRAQVRSNPPPLERTWPR